MKRQTFRLLLSFFALAVILFLFYVGGVIMGNAGSDAAAFDKPPSYLVILGCRLEGEEPGSCLKERLDKAADYLTANPDCMAVASGGQGEDEVISEAEAISRGLVKRGISPERILKEEQSTSTVENFAFSKELLDKREDGAYYIAFVTNEYHVYRSRRVAERTGFLKPTAVSAKSSAVNFYPNFLREIAAVIYDWIKNEII